MPSRRRTPRGRQPNRGRPETLARKLTGRQLAIPFVTVGELTQWTYLRRWERLTGKDPLRLIALVSEAVLLQQIGGPAVLRDQLLHLATVLEEHPDTIQLRVIPFTAPGSGVFGASTFHLIDFTGPRLPVLAWLETVSDNRILDEDTQVRELSFTHADALAQSLSTKDSLQLAEGYARKLV